MTEKQTSPGLRKRKTLWRRTTRYLFVILLLLLVILGGGGYYFLNTNSGLKQAISLVSRCSDYEIKADSISGVLLNKSELKNVSVKGKHFNFYSDNVTLDWQSKDLFNRSVTINAITLKNSVVELSPDDGKKKNDSNEYQPYDLGDIDLPFALRLKDLLVEKFTFRDPLTQKPDFIVDHLQVGIDYIGQVGTIQTFRVRGEGVDLKLTGQIETRGDFPLSLENTTLYESKAYGESIVAMTVKGCLKKQLDLQMTGKGISDFTLQANVTSLLNYPTFSADFILQKINSTALGLVDTAATAKVSATGGLSQTIELKTQGEMFYQSPQTDNVKLAFIGSFDGEQFTLADLKVGLLTAKQQLTGQGYYRLSDKTLTLTLDSPILQYPQQHPEVSANNLQFIIDGSLNDYHLGLNADTNSSAAGNVPFRLQAKGSTIAVKDLMATALIGGNPLDIKGNLVWSPTLAFKAQVTAPHILPTQKFPGIKGLDINVVGDNKMYRAKGNLHCYADNLPPTDIRLDVRGTPQYLEKADLTVNTLGGVASVNATGVLSPLAVAAKVSTQHIQPQRFYPQIQGDISSEVSINGKQAGDNLSVMTTIDELTGQLQGMPLSGKGKVMFNQAGNQLTVNDLSVNLAGNTINANGLLALGNDGESKLLANIDARQLNTLLPDLAGSLLANFQIKGHLKTPEINGKIDGRDLCYQQHRIHRLNGGIAIRLASDKFTIQAKANGITSGENNVDDAEVSIDGKVSRHQIKAVINTPEKGKIPRLLLAGSGGLNLPTRTWSGHLQQLTMDSALVGKWQLGNAVPLTLSADTIKINSLCLNQQTASLCADGALQQKNGQFKVRMKNLKTNRFAQLLPETVKLDTTFNASADLVVLSGRPEIKGQISASGGRLKIFTGSGQLDDTIEQLESKFSLNDNRLQTTLSSQLAKIGTLHLAAELPDIEHNTFQANVKINTPKLNFLQELVPQLNYVKGSLTGDMTLSGVPDKRLNMAGKVTLHKTDFDVPQFGTQIRAMTLDIFSQNGNHIGFKGGAKAGGGRIDIIGNINPSKRQGEINIKGKNCQVADSRRLKVTINPDLRIVFTDTINVRGDIVVPTALIVPDSTGSKITASEDVVLANNKGKKQPVKSPIDVEVNIKLGDDVRVASADIATRLFGGIRLIAKPGKTLTANGEVSIKTGALQVYGQQLDIKHGRVIFSNGPITNPALDVRAIREIDGEDVTVGMNVLGHISKPEISLFSTPSMPDSSILSYLLFGKPPNSNTFSSIALLQTGGMAGINSIARHVRSSTKLDVLEISFSGLEVGKNLTKKIYVGVYSSFFDAINQFLLKYKISGTTRVEASIGTDGISTDWVKEIETNEFGSSLFHMGRPLIDLPH